MLLALLVALTGHAVHAVIVALPLVLKKPERHRQDVAPGSKADEKEGQGSHG